MPKIALASQANPNIGASSACRPGWSPATRSTATSADSPFSIATALPRFADNALPGKSHTPPSSSDRGLTLGFQSATWTSEPNRKAHEEIHLTPT